MKYINKLFSGLVSTKLGFEVLPEQNTIKHINFVRNEENVQN